MQTYYVQKAGAISRKVRTHLLPSRCLQCSQSTRLSDILIALFCFDCWLQFTWVLRSSSYRVIWHCSTLNAWVMDTIVGLKIIIYYLLRRLWRISHKALTKKNPCNDEDGLQLVMIWRSLWFGNYHKSAVQHPTVSKLESLDPAHWPSIVCNFGQPWEWTDYQYSPATVDL